MWVYVNRSKELLARTKGLQNEYQATQFVKKKGRIKRNLNSLMGMKKCQ
jgi:hypothetical protein